MTINELIINAAERWYHDPGNFEINLLAPDVVIEYDGARVRATYFPNPEYSFDVWLIVSNEEIQTEREMQGMGETLQQPEWSSGGLPPVGWHGECTWGTKCSWFKCVVLPNNMVEIEFGGVANDRTVETIEDHEFREPVPNLPTKKGDL